VASEELIAELLRLLDLRLFRLGAALSPGRGRQSSEHPAEDRLAVCGIDEGGANPAGTPTPGARARSAPGACADPVEWGSQRAAIDPHNQSPPAKVAALWLRHRGSLGR
jgi:hypothetical protein